MFSFITSSMLYFIYFNYKKLKISKTKTNAGI